MDPVLPQRPWLRFLLSANSFHILESEPKALYMGQRHMKSKPLMSTNLKHQVHSAPGWEEGAHGSELLLRIMPSLKYSLCLPRCSFNSPLPLNPGNPVSPWGRQNLVLRSSIIFLYLGRVLKENNYSMTLVKA